MTQRGGRLEPSCRRLKRRLASVAVPIRIGAGGAVEVWGDHGKRAARAARGSGLGSVVRRCEPDECNAASTARSIAHGLQSAAPAPVRGGVVGRHPLEVSPLVVDDARWVWHCGDRRPTAGAATHGRSASMVVASDGTVRSDTWILYIPTSAERWSTVPSALRAGVGCGGGQVDRGLLDSFEHTIAERPLPRARCGPKSICAREVPVAQTP